MVKRYRAIWGNLRTIDFSLEELRSLLSVSEYCKQYHCSKWAVYAAIRTGKLPAKKIRGRWKVLPVLYSDYALVDYVGTSTRSG